MTQNPIVCECGFHEFQNWTIYLRNFADVHSNESTPLNLQCIGPPQPMQCPHLQTISKEKLSPIAKYAD